MKKPYLHLTSHHSNTIPDQTRRAPPRVNIESSYEDGNISDSSTRPLLSRKGKSTKPSEKSKNKEYVPVIGLGQDNKKTGGSREEEKKTKASKGSYTRIGTTAQEAHEEKQQRSKHIKYPPPDPITLFRYEHYQSKTAEKMKGAAVLKTWYEEQNSRNPCSRFKKLQESWRQDVEDLEELDKEIGDIRKKRLPPRPANRALDDLMKRKGHLLK